jgi:hypothetical protein
VISTSAPNLIDSIVSSSAFLPPLADCTSCRLTVACPTPTPTTSKTPTPTPTKTPTQTPTRTPAVNWLLTNCGGGGPATVIVTPSGSTPSVGTLVCVNVGAVTTYRYYYTSTTSSPTNATLLSVKTGANCGSPVSCP